METQIGVNKVSDFASKNLDFTDCGSDEIEMVLFNAMEIVSPTFSNNLENLLKEKSIALGRKSTLEHLTQESDATLSDTTSLSDEIDFFYDQLNPIFDIESSIEKTNKTTLPREMLGFQSHIHFNTIFEDDKNILECNENNNL